jgi:hypothetical protein
LKAEFFSVLSIIRVKTNIGDTRGNQSGPKSGTGHLEKSLGTDGSTKYTTNFSIQQRKTKEPPKRDVLQEFRITKMFAADERRHAAIPLKL